MIYTADDPTSHKATTGTPGWSRIIRNRKKIFPIRAICEIRG